MALPPVARHIGIDRRVALGPQQRPVALPARVVPRLHHQRRILAGPRAHAVLNLACVGAEEPRPGETRARPAGAGLHLPGATQANKRIRSAAGPERHHTHAARHACRMRPSKARPNPKTQAGPCHTGRDQASPAAGSHCAHRTASARAEGTAMPCLHTLATTLGSPMSSTTSPSRHDVP